MHIKQRQNEINEKVYKTPPCGRSAYSLRQFKMITHLEKYTRILTQCPVIKFEQPGSVRLCGERGLFRIQKEINILSVKRKTNAMINGEVNTQSLFLHYVKCRVTHGAAYTTRHMVAINSHPRLPRCTDFRTLQSQCWTNFMGRAKVTEDGNSLLDNSRTLSRKQHCIRNL